MTLINLNSKSIHDSNITIKNLLLQQLKKLQPNSITVELFKYNSSRLNSVLETNAYLLNVIEKRPTIEDIVSTTLLLKEELKVVNKNIHYLKDSIQNIYLHNVHNVYGIMLLEFNALISNTELQLRNNKLSNKTLDNLVNDQYTRPLHSPPDSPTCCCNII